MPRGAIRKYGRTVVLTDAELVFDKFILEQAKRGPQICFSSSDSSHTSIQNSLEDSSPVPVSRQAKKNKTTKKELLKSKNKGSNENSIKSTHGSSNNCSLLFHEVCTPVLGRKQRHVLKEINYQKPAKTKPAVIREKKVKQTCDSSADQGNNVPDFESIAQDDLIIDCSTPCVPDKSAAGRLGHHVSIFGSPSLNVSHISICDNSDLNHSSNSMDLGQVVDKISANITLRRNKKSSKGQNLKSKKKRSPDSCSLSDDHTTHDSYELAETSADISHSNSVSREESMVVGENSSRTSSGRNGSLSLFDDIQNLSHSFHKMHLCSRDIAAKLASNTQKCSTRDRNPQEGSRCTEMTEGSSIKSPLLFDDLSDCTTPGSHSLPLSEIAEEDSCYSEDDYENEEENESEEEEEREFEKEDSIEECDEENISSAKYNQEEKSEKQSNRSDVTLYELVCSMSFIEKLSNSSISKDVSVSARERVLSLCGQTEPVSFSDCIPPRMMSRCVKIGEGVYGEVFRTFSNKDAVALKIIPIEGDQEVNDCPQKKFEEILPEIVIAKELSELNNCPVNQTSNFCQVNRISCVQGEFPDKLLEQWDVFSENKVSENDRPDIFDGDQLFIVFEFVDGGCPLENFKFSNHMEAFSVLRQVVFALAVAERELEFEHRDLHIGNVLVRSTTEETVSFKLKDKNFKFPTEGVMVTIIDFTISRLKKDGCAVFCDVSTDEGLFEGKGDIQFDVYRDMRKENGNDWQQFIPHSNVLWVTYICKKFLSAIKYKETGRSYRDVQRHLRQLADVLLDFASCVHLTEESTLWELAE